MTSAGPGAAADAAKRPWAPGSPGHLPTNTPSRLRRILVVIIATTILSCVAATVLTLGRRDTVVSARDRTSPALLEALEAHTVLADADRAVWASFRSGEAQLIGPGQDYQDGITTAGQDLAQLAALEATGGGASRRLQTINGQLVNYQGLVGQADATYRTVGASAPRTGSGHELGYAYLTYASKSLRDPQSGLLAGIDKVATINRQTLGHQETALWTSPWLLLGYAAAALATFGALVYAQVFLRRRFRRTISPPMVLATALVLGSSVWLGVVTIHADHAFSTAVHVSLPRLSRIWQTQTRMVDADVRALRAGVLGDSPGARSAAPTIKAGRGGLDIAATQPARDELDSAMAAAADTGGLGIALPLVAAAIAGLAFFGVKPRLDEYRG